MPASDLFLAALLSRLLTIRAWSHFCLSQFEEGVNAAEQACELASKLQNPGLEARARLAWAKNLYRQRKHEQALAHFEQVIALAKTAHDQIIEADGWIGIGSQFLWQADNKPAQKPLLHALDLCQRLQYKPGQLQTLIVLGDLALRLGAYVESVEYDEQALELSRLLGDVVAEAEVLGSIGVGLTALGDLVRSQTYHREALATFRQLNMPDSEQWILGQLGYTAIRLGDFSTAEQDLTEALAISRQLNDQFWQAWVLLRLGELWIEWGEPGKGLPFITDAYETAEQLNNPRFLAAVLYHWGDALVGQSDWVQAEQKFQRANNLWLDSGQIENANQSLAGLAYVAYQQDRLETAAAHAEKLWQTWLDSPQMARRANLKLYWMLGVVWDGLGDKRAPDLWKTANALLQERCEKIPDERVRRMFLEQVPAHRAILEASI